MTAAKYKLAVQTGATSLFAVVEVDVDAPSGGQRTVVRPRRTSEDWHWSERWADAAVLGAGKALDALGLESAVVNFDRVAGTFVDTTNAAVAGAAFAAVFASVGRPPPDRKAIAAWHSQHGFGSDDLPTGLQLLELTPHSEEAL